MSIQTQIIPPNPKRDFNGQMERFCRPRRVYGREGETLHDMMQRAIPDPIQQNLSVVMMAGEAIPRRLWKHIKPKIHTVIQIGLRPNGGGARKILRTVLIVAVVVVAAWIAGPAGVALLGKTGALIASAAFTVVANLAINALLPPPSLSTSARPEQEPTYSIQGARNQGRPLQTCPVTLGDHRFVPDLITEYLQEPAGDDVFLTFGVCVGVGNYEVSEWRIGDTPIEQFDGITIQESLTVDAPTQTLIPGDFSTENLGIDLATTDTEIRRTTNDVSDIDVVLYFPRGLGTVDDDGDPENVTITVNVDYRVVNEDGTTGPWQNGAANNGAELDDIFEQEFGENRVNVFEFGSIFNPFSPQVTANFNPLSRTYRRSDTKPFPSRIRIPVPPGRQYDVRVQRTTARDDDVGVANDVTWNALTSWRQSVSLTPDARLATAFIRILASGELSGVVDTLNCRAKKIIPTFKRGAAFDPALATAQDWDDNATTSRNNADVLLDVNRGLHTDNPLPDDEIDFEDFAAFWIWCDQNNFTFDLPIQQDLARAEVEEMVAAAGRARVYRGTDGKKHIAIDRERIEGPTQIITPRNARNFNFTRTFARPVHALRIPFTNRENDFEDDELIVYANGHDEDTATLFEQITTPGTTDPAAVFTAGNFYLQSALTLSTVVTFEMDIEGRTLSLGDFVRLQHPVLNEAALSARVFAVDGNDIHLDAPLGFDAAQNYVLRYRVIKDFKDGTAAINGEGLVALINPGKQTDVVTLAEPLPAGLDLTDKLVVVGIAGEDTFEGLVRAVTPAAGPNQVDVELVAYLPERLTVPAIPPHSPPPAIAFTRPPTPVLIGHSSAFDHITVSFGLPEGYTNNIAAFQARYVEERAGDNSQAFIQGPDLPRDATQFTIPAGTPGRRYRLEILSRDFDGLTSRPLVVAGLEAYNTAPAPQGAAAVPRVLTNGAGVQIPVIDITVAPVQTTVIETLLIETRPAAPATGPAQDWGAPTSTPSNSPSKQLTGLTPGAVIDIRLAWRDVRGSVTPEAQRPILSGIVFPAEFTAANTVNVAGQPATELVTEVSQLRIDLGTTIDVEESAAFVLAQSDLVQAAEDRIEGIEGNLENIQADINLTQTQIEDDAAIASQSLAEVLTIENNIDGLRAEVIDLRNQTAQLNTDAQGAVTATADNVLITDAAVTQTELDVTAANQARLGAEAALGDAEIVRTDVANLTQDAEDAAVSVATSETLTAEFLNRTLELARLQFPKSMQDADDFFIEDFSGHPDTDRPVTGSPDHSPIINPIEGAGIRTTAEQPISQRQALPAIVGNTYRLTVRGRLVAPSTNGATYRAVFYGMHDDYAGVGSLALFDLPAASAASTFTVEYVLTQARFDQGVRWLRAVILPNSLAGAGGGDGVYETFLLGIEDITSEAAARTSADLTTLSAVEANESAAAAEFSRQAIVQLNQPEILLRPNAAQNDWVFSNNSLVEGDQDFTDGSKLHDVLPADTTIEVVGGVPEIVFDGVERGFYCRETIAYSPTEIKFYRITCQIKYDRTNSSTTDRLLLGAYYLKDDYSRASLTGGFPEDLVARTANGLEWTDIEWLFAASVNPLAGWSHMADAELDPETVSRIRIEGQSVYNNGDGKMRLRNFAVKEVTENVTLVDGSYTLVRDELEVIRAEAQTEQAVLADVRGFLSSTSTVTTTAGNALSQIAQRAFDTGDITYSDIVLSADKLVHEVDGEVIWQSDETGLLLKRVLRFVGGGTPGNPDFQICHGIGFGANNDLMFWYGPYSAGVDSLTAENGIEAKTLSGGTFLGGSNQLATIISASDTHPTTASLSGIGTNGNTQHITGSIVATSIRTYTQSTPISSSTFTAGGASFTVERDGVQIENVTGITGTVVRSAAFDFESSLYHVTENFSLGKSVTNSASTGTPPSTHSFSTIKGAVTFPPSHTNLSSSVSVSILENP